MSRIFDSLAVRIAAVFLAGLVALQLVIALILVWPERPAVFPMVSPQKAAAMARALEAASPALQPLIVDALNSAALIVQLMPDFPAGAEAEGPMQDAPWLARRYAEWGDSLAERPLRVQFHGGAVIHSLSGEAAEGPLRLVVRLRTGQALVIERAPVLLQRLSGRFLAIGAASAAVLLMVLLACMRGIARPIRVLAMGARRVPEEIAAPDLPLRGPRELKELASALNHMKRTIRALIDERTRILAAIAHDLRTYLTRLRLRADFIDDPDQRCRAVTDLEEMALLLDDTMMFAREATAGVAPREAVDIRREVASFTAARQEPGLPLPGLPSPGAPLLEAADGALLACCAPLALRRMLSNLVDNAVRYGGGVRLRAWREAEQIAIAVEDDGPGVPEEALDRMTAPFERLEPSRGRQTGGAGLGLAIVKALAASQGGSLSIANRPEGGLQAVIRLPAAAGRTCDGLAA
jgi:two-component system osmolarity sensor histidine kinase EnvZ